jgi:hypothetical protein
VKKDDSMLKVRFMVTAYVGLIALLMMGSSDIATAATKFRLAPSPEIPAAQGTVRFSKTKNGNVQIKLDVKHLATPGTISPGAEVFVFWARGLMPGAQAQNLGALIVDKNLNGRLTASTAMPSFDLFLTCEQAQTATVSGLPELLSLRYPGK